MGWRKQRTGCECASECVITFSLPATLSSTHPALHLVCFACTARYRLAVEKTSTWLMVDAWESLQDEYQRTAVVLDHFNDEINGGSEGGVMLADGSKRRIRVMLLAGGDLIQSMGEPGVWAEPDVSA